METSTDSANFRTKALKHFRQNKILTVKKLFAILNTKSRMTVFRKLKLLNYISSYSHSGKYYSVPEVAHFNEDGLWHVNGIGFSVLGHLKHTLIAFIEKSPGGKSQHELRHLLKINVHNTLLKLIHAKKINRIEIEDIFIYLSADDIKSRKQIEYRKTMRYGMQANKLPDWLVIEVMASIIRISQPSIDINQIILELASRDITIPVETINAIIINFDLKKTPD